MSHNIDNMMDEIEFYFQSILKEQGLAYVSEYMKTYIEVLLEDPALSPQDKAKLEEHISTLLDIN